MLSTRQAIYLHFRLWLIRQQVRAVRKQLADLEPPSTPSKKRVPEYFTRRILHDN